MTRLLAALAAVVLLLTACSADGDGGTGGGTAGFVGGDGTFTIVPTDQRVEAPVLAGVTLEGEELSTADLVGAPVVINVWGSWCAPCRSEAPELVQANEELDGVAFLGINTRDTTAAAQAFERTFEITWPSLFDPDGVLLLEFAQLPPKAIPSTVVLDEEGRVAARVLGEVSASTLRGIVEDVTAP